MPRKMYYFKFIPGNRLVDIVNGCAPKRNFIILRNFAISHYIVYLPFFISQSEGLCARRQRVYEQRLSIFSNHFSLQRKVLVASKAEPS